MVAGAAVVADAAMVPADVAVMAKTMVTAVRGSGAAMAMAALGAVPAVLVPWRRHDKIALVCAGVPQARFAALTPCPAGGEDGAEKGQHRETDR